MITTIKLEGSLHKNCKAAVKLSTWRLDGQRPFLRAIIGKAPITFQERTKKESQFSLFSAVRPSGVPEPLRYQWHEDPQLHCQQGGGSLVDENVLLRTISLIPAYPQFSSDRQFTPHTRVRDGNHGVLLHNIEYLIQMSSSIFFFLALWPTRRYMFI
jgi:hypothetical protein